MWHSFSCGVWLGIGLFFGVVLGIIAATLRAMACSPPSSGAKPPEGVKEHRDADRRRP